MNRWLLSNVGAEMVAHVGLALIIVGLIAEALLIVDALTIGFLSEHTDKVSTVISTSAIALGVWLEYIGNKEVSEKKDALLNGLRQQAAEANERILKMQKQRRLTDREKDALRPLLKSELFQDDPKPSLLIGAVADAEAQMYAMDFQGLFESCAVNIYPTNGGLPHECVQKEPNAEGLVMTVKDTSKPIAAFLAFQRLMHLLEMKLGVESDPSRRENEAMLAVLKKPY